MKFIFGLIVIVLGALLAAMLIVGLAVLAATGLGWLLALFLPFSLFEATLLSLIALALPIYLAVQFGKVATSSPLEEDDWEDEDDEWDEEDEEEDEEIEYNAAIPRWRQPIKLTSRFAGAKPDDRCPCGSGRKYKNCHGRGKS